MTRRPARGTTLVELMVALLIGSILVLATFSVMAIFESRRRTIDSNSDLEQSGNVAMFQLDEWLRGAGTGLAQSGSYAYGCKLFAARSGAQILPSKAPLPAPFAAVNAGVPGVFRMAPALILPGQTAPGASVAGTPAAVSDVLVLMSGGSGYGQVPALFSAKPAEASLSLLNTLAFAPDDLVLLVDRQQTASGIAPCLLSQVATGFVPTSPAAAVTALPLGGAGYAATVDTTSVVDFSESGAAIDLGQAGATTPTFQLVGVGDNDTLYSYDLLQTSTMPLRARAEGVFELHALYGVDTDNDGKIDSWVRADGGDYAVASLSTGDARAAGLLKSIRALRVGLILRTSLPERKPVAASARLTLFSDLPGAVTFTRELAASEQNYRYRVIESTIPLRNNSF